MQNYTIVSVVPPTQETMNWIGENYFDIIGVDPSDDNDDHHPAKEVDTPEALAEALTEGGKVKLANDMVMAAPLNIEKDTKIDLGGHTLDFTGVTEQSAITNTGKMVVSGEGEMKAKKRLFNNAGELEIKGGSFESTSDVLISTSADSKLTINGGEFKAQECAVLAGSHGANVVINDGTFTCVDNACVMGNGVAGNEGNTITINGGEFNGNIKTKGYVACGIYVPNNDTVYFNGGTMNITGGCGICARAGKTFVNGGVINTTGNATGKVGDSRIVVPCAAIVFDAEAAYPGLTDDAKVEIAAGAQLNSEVEPIAWIHKDEDTTERIFDNR